PEYQKLKLGECCPTCPEIAEVRSTCTYEGQTYQNNDTWNLDSCRSCRCHSGEIRCAQTKCPKPKCKANEVLVTPPDQCCSKCEETAGVCTKFGSHYKTFDGKFFDFHGSCKYQLTADCYNHTFSIRITNDGRKTKTSSWTKTVTLKFGGVKVNLGQNLRVKVNGTKINFPFKWPSVLEINRTTDSVTVRTSLGIQLYWDRNHLLQVQSLKDMELFEMCGNRLNPQNYFESCKQDVCECPNNGKCYCDSFSAYAHECARLGVKLPNSWRKDTGCDIPSERTTISTPLTAAKNQQGLKRHRKRFKRPNRFFTRHVPKTFLVHKHHSQTPPPIH
ncbi:Kielin/chordin-like protein, partial [Pseudolycoriella hygida]